MAKTGWVRRAAAALVILGWLTAVLPGMAWAQESQGEQETPAPLFGVVDSVRIINEYLDEEMRVPLEQAIRELQEEFDRESEGLEEPEKERLFMEYQGRLDAIRDALIQERVPRIQSAIQEVAQANGIVIVFDSSAIHYGGVDLTDQVLARLGVVAVRP